MIGDSFTTGLPVKNKLNIHLANYPSAKIDNVVKTVVYFSDKFDELNTVVVHTGANDIKYGRKTEELKDSFKILYERTQHLSKRLVISGPIPTKNCTCEHFSRICALNEWLGIWCKEKRIDYVNNFKTDWSKLNLLNYYGTSLNMRGKQRLIKNIDYAINKKQSD